MTHILDYLGDRVILCDGAFGSRIQALDLDIEKDYLGQENCTEILNRSRPDLIRDIHTGYFAAGADAVETNSFGGSPITLGEFGLADDALEINQRAAELAREAVELFHGDGRTRFVLGSVGPGTRLPSLGHTDYRTLEQGYRTQCQGLLAGSVDAILIETCQDVLQIKSAVNGAKAAIAEAGAETPIFVQVTVETTGTLLVGADIAAAATVINALGVPLLGLNCATGPQEMAEHVKWLAENWPGLISVLPNAGLPELVDGEASYPLSPADLARWLERFITEDGVSMVGGCCGTDIEHIEAVDAMLVRLGGRDRRPAPKRRSVHWVPSVASLYAQVPLRQENAYLSIGERCNANGSRRFRELQDAGDWDGCVAMGREQEREGSHTLDLCTAYVGRDEAADMAEMVGRMRGGVTAPLVFDSTELGVLKTALELYGGKPILNSINFEDGEEPAAARLALAKKFGAAVIALTIDEEGMAKDADSKLRIAKRLFEFACKRHGLPASDLLFDPLTFTICTGNADDRRLGLETLDAIERIRTELPDCQVILGLSNISFGLAPAARQVLNSVFLDHALRRGLTGAIVHVSKILPLHMIPPEEVKIAEDLIFNRREEGYEPLHAFLACFENRKKEEKRKVRPASVEERLKAHIIDGDRQGLEDDLDTALADYPALEIINKLLLDGMKTVGELFGSGKLQLPFVLQSAETMKAAVAYLEPHLERVDGQSKGTIVLATVKGDVHDIGKNLVDIILTNNGYRVVNLGIKQPVANIIEAARKNAADAVGMSGLLVKSTVVMRENLVEMTREGIDIPVLLGGAALTRGYVEEDCVAAYGSGRVAYARDAFDGLGLMAKVEEGAFDAHTETAAGKRERRPSKPRKQARKEPAGELLDTRLRPPQHRASRTRRASLRQGIAIPDPPFLGARVIEQLPARSLIPYLNETMLYQFHWGYRKQGRRKAEFLEWARAELRPILSRLITTCEADDVLMPKAVYGYWKCAGDGDEVVLFEANGTTERARFAFPRQQREDGLCIADFFRPIDDSVRDVIALQVVTMGGKASETAREWFAADRYRDYLYLHGLSVELAEALAEYVHKRIREELGIADKDAREIDKMLRQGYRGSRYSFGYPACPDLSQQHLLLKLLGADRIGIEMSEGDQLHPEQSTAAIVVHHPQARYFTL
jgi:5-methyltetrahydrofolate--homocysteine methyltransferase